MASIPTRPFLPDDFSPGGGGVDYLGMRWVSFTMLAERLIPGVNNRTRDFGIFCLATWIPWKFRQITPEAEFTSFNFRQFEEAVGVAISHSVRQGSPSLNTLGEPHEKIGVQQNLELPSELSFDAAERTRSTSIFAAQLYGPSLRYLGLLSGNARATDGTSTDIPLVADTDASLKIARTVENALNQSSIFQKLFDSPHDFNQQELDELGECGINPAFYKETDRETKIAFLKQLAPADDENFRTKTTKLLVKTLELRPSQTLEDIRAAWHTGLLPNNDALKFDNDELNHHREVWATFQTRQYQRYVVELFMKCFEEALLSFGKLDDIVGHHLADSKLKEISMETFMRNEAEPISKNTSWLEVSKSWNHKVHGDHELYDWIDEEDGLPEIERALKMLSRWWIRVYYWIKTNRHSDLLELGGEDRISIAWFHRWVEDRLEQDVASFIHEVFEQLVFGQHIRVALSRFDGKAQKLRFLLGDDGIVPTKSAIKKMGKSVPSWMADRLQAFVDLLSDIGVVVDDEGVYNNGPLATKL